MRILVIGSGGREHAILRKLNESPLTPTLCVYPGNPGQTDCAKVITEDDLKNFEFQPESPSIKRSVDGSSSSTRDLLVQWSMQNKIELVIVGPEKELVQGYADAFRANGIACVGPDQAAAQLEGSKIFAKVFMYDHKIPTAKFHVVSSVEETMRASTNYTAPYILKADGLAAGKGVFICKDLQELENSAHELFIHKKLGPAGTKAVLEANLPGYELSVLLLTNGEEYELLPIAQDHKRLLDGDQGPNTGGMGTVAPLKIEKSLMEKIKVRIIEPTLKGIRQKKLNYRGVIFLGLMIVDNEPFLLEYNVRFGDPETQVILPLIQNDFVQVMLSLSSGKLEKLSFKKEWVVCIVNAAYGYPDQPRKGDTLTFKDIHFDEMKNIFFCGVQKSQMHPSLLITSGGRVLNCIGIDSTLQSAREQAYKLNSKIDFSGRQFRTDIGAKVTTY